MKKRIFSLLLVLAMCLTMLPGAALAEEMDTSEAQVIEPAPEETPQAVPAPEPTPEPTPEQKTAEEPDGSENGIALYADETSQHWALIQPQWGAISYIDIGKDETVSVRSGHKIQLLADSDNKITLQKPSGNTVTGVQNVTLDINGHTLGELYIKQNVHCTIIDSGSSGNGKITTVTLSTSKQAFKKVSLQSGHIVNIATSDYNEVALSGGSVEKVTYNQQSGSIKNCLAPGYALADADGNVYEYANAPSSNAYIVPCPGHVVEETNCIYCNEAIGGKYVYTPASGEEKAFGAFDEAKKYAAANPGGTLTLYNDAVAGYLYGKYTLDLNGRTLEASSDPVRFGDDDISTQITITGNGKIPKFELNYSNANVTIENGEFQEAKVVYGKLTVSGGEFGTLFVYSSAELSGGSFENLNRQLWVHRSLAICRPTAMICAMHPTKAGSAATRCTAARLKLSAM